MKSENQRDKEPELFPDSTPVDLCLKFLEECMLDVIDDSAMESMGQKPSAKLLPERNLCAAMLAAAFTDLKPNRAAKARERARNYLLGIGSFKNHQYIFSAAHCCRVLKLDLSLIRRAAIERYHNPSDFNWY